MCFCVHAGIVIIQVLTVKPLNGGYNSYNHLYREVVFFSNVQNVFGNQLDMKSVLCMNRHCVPISYDQLLILI